MSTPRASSPGLCPGDGSGVMTLTDTSVRIPALPLHRLCLLAEQDRAILGELTDLGIAVAKLAEHLFGVLGQQRRWPADQRWRLGELDPPADQGGGAGSIVL